MSSNGGCCYNTVRGVATVVTRSFFRDIEVAGRSNVPADGPLIVVANHQNQFVDPMQLMSAIPRDLSFLMAAVSFQKPVIGSCARWARAVPVTRAQDVKVAGSGGILRVTVEAGDDCITIHGARRGGVSTTFTTELERGAKIVLQGQGAPLILNVRHVVDDSTVQVDPSEDVEVVASRVADAATQQSERGEPAPFTIFPKIDQHAMFDAVLERLLAGGAIGIFPEGGSTDQTHLLPLKAGVAIMALGAAARGATSVRILPCGINYFRGHSYRSRVFVEIGQPIPVPTELVELYAHDRRSATSQLLNVVSKGLQGVTLQAPDWETLFVVRTARRLYAPKRRLSPTEYLELTRRFLLAFEAFEANERFLEMMGRVREYVVDLRDHGVKDRDVVRIRNPGKCGSWMRASMLLLLIPILVCILVPVSLPGLFVGLPIYAYASKGVRKSMEKALAKDRAGANVKVAARDTAASIVLVRAITIFPVVMLTALVLIVVTAAVLWDAEDSGVSPEAKAGILAAIFFSGLVLLPAYVWASQLVFEQAALLCRGLKPLCVQCCRPHDAAYLRDKRRALSLAVRELVQELGPELGEGVWENRIVSAEELAKDAAAGSARVTSATRIAPA